MKFTKAKIAVIEELFNKFQCPYCGKSFDAKLKYNSKKPYHFWVGSACCHKGKEKIYNDTLQNLNNKEFVALIEMASWKYKLKIQ